MARPLSRDLRERVIAACDAGESPEQVGPIFNVSVRVIYNWLELRRQTGDLAPRPCKPGPQPALAEHTRLLRDLVKARPDATLVELREELPVRVGLTTVWKSLRWLGMTLKKEGHSRRRAVAA